MNRLEQLRHTHSLEDLVRLGLEDIAYIKAVTLEGQRFYAIHAADGTPLTLAAERETAIATVRQHDMEPASVH